MSTSTFEFEETEMMSKLKLQLLLLYTKHITLYTYTFTLLLLQYTVHHTNIYMYIVNREMYAIGFVTSSSSIIVYSIAKYILMIFNDVHV